MSSRVRKGRTGALLLQAVLLTCIVLAVATAEAGEVVRVGEKEGGTTVEMFCGDRLAVTLPANRTTGYTWEIASLDVAVLKASGEVAFQPDSRLIGAGGMMTMDFDAAAAGSTILRLIYHRPFEKGVAPLKTFELNVNVKPGMRSLPDSMRPRGSSARSSPE